MKSIRLTILQHLLQHGEQTLDDLQTQLSDVRRDKIYSNIQAAKSDEFVSSRKDIATSLPAYKITEKGKVWLTSKGLTTDGDEPAVSATDTPIGETSAAEDHVQIVEPEDQAPVIMINIVGPIGAGKTLVASMIDQVLTAHGGSVEFESSDEANEARNQPFGDLNPIAGPIQIRVEHDSTTVCCGAARVIATTAAEVSMEYRAQLDDLKEQNRLLAAENSALRLHSLMLGQISDVVDRFEQLGDDTTLGVVTAMGQRIIDLESAVDLSQHTIKQQELEAEQHRARIAALESNGDLLAEAALVSAPEAIAAGKPPFYVSIGRDTGPQIHKGIEPATRRMKSIVRRGDKVGLVLVPILKAIQGVELVEVKAA